MIPSFVCSYWVESKLLLIVSLTDLDGSRYVYLLYTQFINTTHILIFHHYFNIIILILIYIVGLLWGWGSNGHNAIGILDEDQDGKVLDKQ